MHLAYTQKNTGWVRKNPVAPIIRGGAAECIPHGPMCITFRNPLPLEAEGYRMSLLRLPLSVYRELRAHGEESFPQECCGALLGRATADGWQVDSLVRARNTHAESLRNRYEIAPVELIKIAHKARSRGLEIVGFYHSHPGQPAQWSATDLEEAHWLGCVTVITEVVQGSSKDTKAFLLAGTAEEDKHFVPCSIQIDANQDRNPA